MTGGGGRRELCLRPPRGCNVCLSRQVRLENTNTHSKNRKKNSKTPRRTWAAINPRKTHLVGTENARIARAPPPRKMTSFDRHQRCAWWRVSRLRDPGFPFQLPFRPFQPRRGSRSGAPSWQAGRIAGRACLGVCTRIVHDPSLQGVLMWRN